MVEYSTLYVQRYSLLLRSTDHGEEYLLGCWVLGAGNNCLRRSKHFEETRTFT